VLGAVFGAMSLFSTVISMVCYGILDDGIRASRFAGVGFALGIMGVLASVWNLPRMISIVGVALSVGSMVALYLASVVH
jgi:hypothetical protein